MTTDTSRIVKTPDVCGGDARIDGHRVPVWVLFGYRQDGLSDAEILTAYPSLTLADLKAAWEYAAANQSEIEQAIRENEE